MAKKVNARVELKKKHRNPNENFKEMLRDFKRKVSNAGVMHSYKEHQFFVSNSELTRREKRVVVSKMRLELLEEKILSGERVKAPSGLIKKVREKQKKEKERQEKKMDDYLT